MINPIEYIKSKIRTRKAKTLAREIVVWLGANNDSSMGEFTTMMEGHGFYISGFSIAGDEVVFANNDNCQINIKLGVKGGNESESLATP